MVIFALSAETIVNHQSGVAQKRWIFVSFSYSSGPIFPHAIQQNVKQPEVFCNHNILDSAMNISCDIFARKQKQPSSNDELV